MEVQDSKILSQCSSMQKMLLVGEGEFSFSLSLAKAFASVAKITAVSLDVRVGLGRQYNNGKGNVEELERLGCTVVHGVNVHTMTSDFRLSRYDRIVFDFPHAGKHKDVVRGFIESAREMVNESGEIYFTNMTMYPFNKLDIKSLAGEKGLRLIQPVQFKKWIFPGYSTKSDFHFPFRLVISMIKM
ncbi:unnamed protein product [Eruca vesicaria subsp. sativa]|uniref:25S rRNA (uridine-N(3))-methyltransferase BMT5-like domain-containing protein n=1 Tax=Eruca vesicaria subsp. sativa TaxID=29727 RepID=A0ABC8IY31_ERUVS|nr:unnamed protein product [Eruca vesicaria subsp. sativa]